MRNGILLAVGAVLLLVLGGIYFASLNRQHDQDSQLRAMQKKLDALATTRPEDVVLTVGGGSSQPAGELEKVRQTRAVMEEAWKLVNTQNPEKARQAVRIFQEAIANIDAQNVEFYNGLGRAQLVAGEPKAAIQAWRQGLALKPQSAIMQSGIGWGYWYLNDPYHAKEAWEKALQIDPKLPDAWASLAWIYMAMGEKQKAQEGFAALCKFESRDAWNAGLTMARAGNQDLTQIRKFFPVPALERFSQPPAVDPAPATAPTSQPR